MSDNVYDLPIGEVAKLLDKSDRQVRRYVKGKRLKARPVRVDGHIKLMFNKDQVMAFKDSLIQEGAFGETGDEIVVDAQLIGDDGASSEDDRQELDGTVIDGSDTGDGDTVKYVIEALKDQIVDLQDENRELHQQLERMSGLVGFHQGRAETLQEQLKMLAPAQKSQEEITRRKPWYRRMFGG